MKCNLEGCRFAKDCSPVQEEYLECKSPTVQLAIEVRAASSKKDQLCGICNKKGVSKVGGGVLPTISASPRR